MNVHEYTQINFLGSVDATPGLLRTLLDRSILLREDFAALPENVQEAIGQMRDLDQLLSVLLEHRLLTQYQIERIRSCYPGDVAGRLVLGNYRILDTLGVGGMGVVFRGEHVLMRRQVAIKVLLAGYEAESRVLARFLTEMRTVSSLRHPNIVAAFDAGRIQDFERSNTTSYYLVMEYVQGRNLHDIVSRDGTLRPAEACELAYQVAGALVEIHENHLVHRDIKPSNVLVTNDCRAKLLDFGLARHFNQYRLTDQGSILGTYTYMAPEQIEDPSNVDIRADIYGLGGTLYWCLTGQDPFAFEGVPSQHRGPVGSPPALRKHRPDLPVELEAVVSCMMAHSPQDRYPTPCAAMRALLPFLDRAEARLSLEEPSSSKRSGKASLPAAQREPSRTEAHSVLIVDDDALTRAALSLFLKREGFACVEVATGSQALAACTAESFDLVLLDLQMPEMDGEELLGHLRDTLPSANMKIILVSGSASADEMAIMLSRGADDYLLKPVSPVQLTARVRALCQLKKAQDRTAVGTRDLFRVNADMERELQARDGDILQIRTALIMGIVRLIEQRTTGTSGQLVRVQRYVRHLAQAARSHPAFAEQIDAAFLHMLETCAPLYDIGKVVIPDELLRKPGRLTPEEKLIVQSHTVVGAESLRKIAQSHGTPLAFLRMAADIARHHHECFDGSGYPDGLSGKEIPLAARIVALADVYDALRSPRAYRPAFSHPATLALMRDQCQGQFDPLLFQVFLDLAPDFDSIFRESPNTVVSL